MTGISLGSHEGKGAVVFRTSVRRRSTLKRQRYFCSEIAFKDFRGPFELELNSRELKQQKPLGKQVDGSYKSCATLLGTASATEDFLFPKELPHERQLILSDPKTTAPKTKPKGLPPAYSGLPD